MIVERALRWEVMNSGGWEYLLPRAERRRWLCLDASRGATALLLAGLCDELYVIPADRAASTDIAEKLRAEGVINTRLTVDGEFPAEDVPGDGFDGFILHDLRGVLDRRTVEQALRRGERLVTPDGFVYAALRNRYGYTRLRRRLSGILQSHSGAYFSAGATRRLIGEGRKTVLYPLISNEDGQITEMVPPSGYVSAKNPSLANEYLRRCFLGSHGAPRWSSAFALVAAGDPKIRSGLAWALDTLKAHGCLGLRVDSSALIKRYLVLNGGKAIVSVGETPGKYGSHIVVLVRSPEFVERRRHEGGLLSRLAALPTDIASRIPRFFYEDNAGGAHVFVLQEFPGITLDAPHAGLRVATRDAAHFITRLHLATRQAIRPTPLRLHAMFGSALETARRRYPPLIATLDRLEAVLRRSLDNTELPAVWMHGDFKIENVVIDERSYRLLGVIDWELSEPEGLPLLDLWYLFLYNRQIERGLDFVTAAEDLLPPQQLTDEEAALSRDYIRTFNVPPELVPSLAGMLVLHHAARRMEYDLSDTGTIERLRKLLERVTVWIDGVKSPSPAGVRNAASRDA